ncbi:dUTP diphosphatase [Campylobacter sputorum]|nr:dUTP diphosphatase [Campylobacter sputorum]KAB0582011.1 dUTPase [Campylobacter sputorum subsp. sputorum]QEL05046.1 dUTPase, dimeric [Campylobacter sputorum subsp. sputorum]
MDYIKMLKTMLDMQQRLNDQTCGEGWESGYTKDGKLISWKRCIYMECAELINSFSWKHWKNISQSADMQNARIEVVDIWHFIMSLMLEYYTSNSIGDKDILSEHISSVSGFSKFCNGSYIGGSHSDYEIVNDIESLIHKCSGFSYKLEDILTNYFRIALSCGVNLNVLFKLYIGKNVLNRFRQEHGYKDGKYKKYWNGKEDNEIMNAILDSGIIEEDEIYNVLEKEYQKS